MHALLVKAVLVTAAVGGSVAGYSQAHSSATGALDSSAKAVMAQAQYQTYTVQPGDTLANIALRFCGSMSDYPALAAASGISDPNLIYAGEHIVLACGGGSTQGSQPAIQTQGSVAAPGQANIPGTYPTVFSFYGLEQIWLAAGGSSSAQAVAACIAEHESSGVSDALSPTNDYGLWQIHNGGDAMFNPLANAQEAVAMSDDGTNWSAWTTAPDCGVLCSRRRASAPVR
jgi:LysM repeat protein